MNHETRCHDDHCGVREQCDRWKTHDYEGIHATTLKSMWIPHQCPCSHYVGQPIEDDDELG